MGASKHAPRLARKAEASDDRVKRWAAPLREQGGTHPGPDPGHASVGNKQGGTGVSQGFLFGLFAGDSSQSSSIALIDDQKATMVC
jgi:hypothetical protein